MIYYLLLWLAVIIGQLFFTTVAVWIWQRKNPNINYWQAVRLYVSKEVGTYVVIFFTTIVLMFILQDWMDLNISKAELMVKETLTRFEKAQMKFRTYATGYGTFAHLIALLLFKGGKNAIEQFGKSKGIDDLNEAK